MTTPDLDGVSERMRAHVHKWHDASSLSNPQLTRLITDQRIDILVELTGHFVGHKLPVLAARPAPVQVSFIGYANTTGTDRIDARFVDEITDPPPRADTLATETLVRLPHCFLCYKPDPDAPEPGAPDPDRPVTIGSFNNLAKLSDPTLGVWSRLLRERPDARLVLKATRLDHEELRDELLARFEELGVERERLDLRGSAPRFTDHLAMYDELDVALDPFPYNGTTTTCEALWMGVPTVTLAGETHAGRVGASLLTAAGLDDWITETQDDYAARALAAIDEGVRGRDQRLALRERVASSTLCDASSYAPRVESAYRALWKSWCASRGSAP